MSPRLEAQGDDERGVEALYGAPQHETDSERTEEELYGDPQHDTTDDDFPSEFDPDFGHVLGWFDYLDYHEDQGFGGFDARQPRRRVRERP